MVRQPPKHFAASVDENLEFVRYLVDPRKAEGLRLRQTLTLAVQGESCLRRLELRSGVLVLTWTDAAAPTHIVITREGLASFVLGTGKPVASDALSQLDRLLDSGHLMPAGAVESVMKGMKSANSLD